jgi:hypothetical protein
VLLQAYFDRWGIEVNHRDEKEILTRQGLRPARQGKS